MLIEQSNCGRFQLALLLSATIGCGVSTVPGRIAAPKVNPSAAANKALETYDADSSGAISHDEAANCPGVLSLFDQYDADGDGQITVDEMESHLSQVFSGGAGLVPVFCRVSAGGRPLSGAQVRFIPEQFLADVLKPAAGMTDANGSAAIAIADEDLPADQRGLNAMQPGVYRIEIDHPRAEASDALFGFEVNPTSRIGTTAEVRL